MFKLKINEFRGFQNQSFQFSRVNILIGENSAGKSSLLKFLLTLKQSLARPNNEELNLTFSGNEVDLGNYKEVIFNHEVDRKLSFSFELGDNYMDFYIKNIAGVITPKNEIEKFSSKIVDAKKITEQHFGGKITTPIAVQFELSNDLSNLGNVRTTIYNSELGTLTINRHSTANIASDLYLTENKLKCDVQFESKRLNKKFTFESIDYEQDGFLTRIKFISIIDELIKVGAGEVSTLIAFFITTIPFLAIEHRLIQYINPLLSAPAKRVYYENDKKNIQQIKDIKDLIDYLTFNDEDETLQKGLSKILNTFGIADKIYLKKEGSVREVRIVMNGLDNNITDVGFGVSLQLPIFAQALLSNKIQRHASKFLHRKGQNVLIEQPEVHLHPKLQAKFIEALMSIGNDNVYFIETHSEHIVRMLQVLVKEKRFGLQSEDVTIHYFRKEGKNMVTTAHAIDEKTGKLKPNFPKGFYDASYNLAFQLLD
jgi:predicted ATPase